MGDPARVSPPDDRAGLDQLLEEDPVDLYENAPCGYLSALPDGRVVKVNGTFCAWTGRSADDLLGLPFQELLGTGGRVFYETHLAPLLRMQGAVQEVALDILRADGSRLPCLVNFVEVRDEVGAPVLLRATVFDATSRRRYEQELLAAQRAAAESEARSRTVQQVVSELAAAVSAEDVARVVVARSRQAVHAAGAALWLLTDGLRPGVPGVEQLAVDGVPEPMLAELAAALPRAVPRGSSGGVRTLTPEAGLRRGRPALAEAMVAAGLTALVMVPVITEGRRLAVITVLLGASGGGGLIDLAEPEEPGMLAQADAELLGTIGSQAGQAMERARLHEEAERQAARSAFLLDAARLLSSTTGVTEVAERLAGLAVPRLADVCVLDLTTEHGFTRPVARHGDPARHRLLAELREHHLPQRGSPHPSVQAMELGRTVWIREVTDEWLAGITRDERHLEIARALELAAMVSVPLQADGRTLGVLTLGADRRRGPFTAADVETAEQLALQVSQVVDKAQRFELESRTSHTLQANLLPPEPPPVAGLSVAVRYLAASRGAEVGGDFYDVVPLPGGEVALAVGDVVGHDITAAAVMGQLRSVYRALLADRPPPSAVIDRLHAGWSLVGLQRMATALFAVLDPGSGRLRIASAGHLPPLLLSGGRAVLLDVQPTRMLGAPPAPSPAAEWTGVLRPGATVVLFTDGLVESRGADLDAGLDRLLNLAAGTGIADPDELCDRLLAELAGGVRADDVALLAITRTA